MNLAITLLMVIAIASVIGTVLQQNQPYQDYIIKFGPYWFEVFKMLGLFDVYSAVWFMVILTFLVLSTSVCIYRNGPGMVREMFRFRENVQSKSLLRFRQSADWQFGGTDTDTLVANAKASLAANGFRTRVKEKDGNRLVSGMKGGSNRLGYVFTHVSIVVICIGALADGNALLKLREWRGDLKIEIRDVLASEVPAESRLGANSGSFRGSVMLPEGSAADFVFLRLREGFLVQELPFAVELEDFRIEHYDTGQPKSFESDLIIHDPNRAEGPLKQTIEVNHPLTYKGYSIYQSDFGDGGSKLNLRAWPLLGQKGEPIEVEGEVGRARGIETPEGTMSLELDDFKVFNIFPVTPGSNAEAAGKKFLNYGPKVVFKVRDAAGQAREYENYMSPIELDGRWFYLTGVRETVADEFAYLHIPADNQAGVKRFLRLVQAVRDEQRVNKILARAEAIDASLPEDRKKMAQELIEVRKRLVRMFNVGGFDEVIERSAEVVPADKVEEATALYINLLRGTLAELFVDVLAEDGVDVSQGVSEEHEQFFDDAIEAMSTIPTYGSPFYLQLANFKHIEASGLQIRKSSAQLVVYFGFALLIAGVFIMFYTSQRRVWAWVGGETGATRMILAGTSNRHPKEFEQEFAALREGLETRLKPDNREIN